MGLGIPVKPSVAPATLHCVSGDQVPPTARSRAAALELRPRRVGAQRYALGVALLAVLLSACSEEGSHLETLAQGSHGGAAPYWDGGTGNGPAVHHLPVPWPKEELDGGCGATCGEWLPYTRFQNSLNDPRTKDPSNGGTSPQNYVNIASSCTDKALPSIYYSLHKDPTDPAKDVLLFRWRVAQDAHTYATGPSAGAFRSGDPWSSALWTVLFNLDGSGYRTLAAHINGSAGSPSAPVDTLAGIYGKIPTQSINYLDDPENIKLLGTQPSAFVGDTGGLLNFQNSLTPTQVWPEGSTATLWDYGTTRASVVQGPCGEYFIDYQIPVAMLDATSQGGPKVTRSTPISMLFCTANSLNNPFQKDCALNREWTAGTNAPGPFGDFISFEKTVPYAQPLITEVIAKAPSDCKTGTYALSAKVQDALWVNPQGVVEPSVKAVSFWYYQDTNGNRLADDGNLWTKASDATLVPGKLNEWRAAWDSSQLLRGSILIGAQAVDDNARVDDAMVPSMVDNRTFSYIKREDQDQLYYRGSWKVPETDFPKHSPAMTAGPSEDWYGNPPRVGVQVAGNVVDVTLNNCGSAPSLKMTGVPSQLSPGESVTFSIVVDNTQSRVAVNVSSLVGELPPGFSYSSGKTSGDFGSADPAVSGTSLTWALSPSVQVDAGASKTLVFVATASNVTGSYNAQANAITNAGNISSLPVPLTVSLARASLTQTPSRYSVKPDGATQVTYTLTYANESSVTLSNATLTNPLPGGVNYISCTGGSTCSSTGTQVTWQLGTLAAGATGSVTFTLTVASTFTATSLTNTAKLTATVPGAGTPLERSSSSTIAVEQPLPPAFSLTMTSDKARVDAGGVAPTNVVTWTITYANQGNGAALGSVLVDTLPAGFTYSSCSVGSSHFTTCGFANGVVTFAGTGSGGIPVGATNSVTVTATVTGTTFSSPNPGVNRATISATGASSVQAQSSVGVNAGQYCSDTYFFRRAADNLPATLRPASLNPPTATTAYFTSVSAPSDGTTGDLTFRQELAFPQDTALGGFTPTVNLYLIVPQGGAQMRIELYKVNTTTNARTLIAANPAAEPTFTLNNNNSSSATLDTRTLAPIAAGTTVQSTERLEWVLKFSANGGSRTISVYYDSVAEQSRSVLCSTAAPPASLSLSNTVDKARISGPVEKLTYTLRYANVGGTAASNVLLRDVLPAGMTACEYSSDNSTWLACSTTSDPQSHQFPLTSLAAGEIRTVYVRGNSPASPTPGQALVNTATLSSTSAASVTATASTAIAPATSGQPLLVITGAADQKVVGPGATVTYTFTVENVGTGPATGVTVSNAIPADMPWYQYVQGSITGGTSRSDLGSPLSWTLGNLAVGAKATLGFQMATSATGLPSGLTARDDLATVSDSSSCTGASRPAGCTSNTVTVMVNGNANLKLSSSATPTSLEPVPPGTFIDYTLTVESVGSSTASGVVLSDSLPPYTRFESVPQGSGGSYDAATNRVSFSLGNLVPGQLEQRTFRVRVDGSLPVGETLLTNVASVRASNAEVRESSVQTRAKAEPKMQLVSSGPTSLPGPAARLAASVSNANVLKVHSAALLEVGGYLRLDNGAITQITDITGTTVTVASPVTASTGAGLWRSAVYTLSFANTGNAAAESVDVTSVLPTGWLYVTSLPAATSAPGVGTPGSMRWDLGRIAAGESSSLRVVAIPTLTATLPSTVKDSYFCTSGTTAGCSSSVTTTVGGLIVRKRTSTPVVSAGGSATYTITLENSFNADVMGVTVTDLLPSGFRYRPGSGTPAPTSVNTEGQPMWSALTVPAQGLEMSFAVDVGANVGSGTYDNWLNVAATGVGVTPFDALSTSDEDVTVLGASAFMVTGYAFRDEPTLGVHDNADTGLEGVVVEVNGGPALGLFSTETDSLGYFQRVIRTGATGTWKVSIPEASNQNVLNGLALYSAYSREVELNPNSPEAKSMRFGYVPAAEATYTVSTQVTEGQGRFLPPTSATVAYGGTATFKVEPAEGYSVKSVTGCDGTLSGNEYKTAPVMENCTVSASFVLNPPNAVDDAVTVAEDSGATVVDVLANDSKVPGVQLTVTAVTQPATGGSVTLEDGVVRFTPAPNVSGPVTFTYTVSDGNGGTDTATVTVTVTPVNDPPTAVADTFSVPTSSGARTLDVLANDTSTPDTKEELTVAAVTQPASGGKVSVAPNGAGVEFTPTPGFVGEVTFTYTLSDGNGGTDTTTVTVTVENAPPKAVADTFSVPTSSGAKTLDVLANDTKESDEELTVTAVTQPASGGTVSVAPNGAGVVFTPAPGFMGSVTFTYTGSDGNGGTDTTTVTVMVENAPPKAVADTFSVPAGSGAKTLDVLANDMKEPDEELTVVAVTQPASGGTVSVAPNGTGVVFTPAPGFTGPVTFTYTVSDGNGGTDTVTVTVEVEPSLNPDDPDDDDDGVLDIEEALTDTDGDGQIDALDPDSDNDGLNDGTERGVTDSMSLPGTNRNSPNYKPDSDPSTTTNPRDPDTDDDGLKDGTEDADLDGYLDDTESDPNDVDTDDGGVSDGEEASYGGNPRDYADDLAVAGRGCTSSGLGTLMPLALLLALPLLRRRQSRRDAVAAWGLLGLMVAVLVAAPASAQPTANVPSQGIDVQQYKPGPGLRDVLGVHSSQVGRHLDWNLGLSVNYAKDPLNFINPRTDKFLYELVKNQFTFDLMGSLALFDRFELGVAVPLTSQSSGSELSVAPLLSGGVHATGVGDLRLVPKAHLLSTDGGLHLGVVVPVLLPTSGGKGFLGRSGVAAFPRVLGEWTSKEGVRVLANVGLNLQPQEQLYNLNVGNEFAYGLATEVPFKLGQHRLAAEATLVGALGLTQTHTEESPLELLGAMKYRFSDALAAHVGAGPGLTRGYGTPGFRLFAGVIWTEAPPAALARVEPPPAVAPVCPQGPEDLDGFQDDDGCADPDNDGDGLLDPADRCPLQPETKNGFEDSDGCADELPPPPPVDTDGDGLTDDQDRCPAVAEDKDGFQDEDGCPDPDNDKDSVADPADKCPFEPETINGVNDEDGCPDKGKVKVRVEGQKIVILDKVYFATNKDVILPRSFDLLKQVAAVLRANPEITKVRVEGHTDSQSSDAFNLNLSQRRANNVRKRLVEKEGIAPERLESVGYGESRPVDTNKTAAGRENNRRVEFIILEMEKLAP